MQFKVLALFLNLFAGQSLYYCKSGIFAKSVSQKLASNEDLRPVQYKFEHGIDQDRKNVQIPIPVFIASVTLLVPEIAHASDSFELSVISIAKPTLDIFINVMNLLFLCRTVLSWYPKTSKDNFPINGIFWATEPLLDPVRQLVPPAFGVDVSSIVWIMLLSFFREIVTGPQGILTLIERA